jgi:hypothetical protein
LSGCDDRDRDCENLGNCSGDGTERELNCCAGRFGNLLRGGVEGSDDRVPVEICEVCGGDTEEGAVDAGIQPRDALVSDNFIDSVEGGCVVDFVG